MAARAKENYLKGENALRYIIHRSYNHYPFVLQIFTENLVYKYGPCPYALIE